MFLYCPTGFCGLVVSSSCSISPSISFSKTQMSCQEELVRDHNARFNPRGVKRGEPSTGDNAEGSEEGPERKRLCVEKSMNLSDESLIEDKPHSWTDPNASFIFSMIKCLITCLVNIIFVIFWSLWIWILPGWLWHAASSRCVLTRKKIPCGLALKNQGFQWKLLRWPSFSDSGLVTLPSALNLGYCIVHRFLAHHLRPHFFVLWKS